MVGDGADSLVDPARAGPRVWFQQVPKRGHLSLGLQELPASTPPGSRRGSHPPAPTDPYVSLSAYTAPAILITRSAGPKEPISNARTCEDTFQWPLANTSWLSSWSAAVCISCESSAPGRR